MIRKLALVLALTVVSTAAAGAQFIPKLEEKDTRDPAVMQAIESFMSAGSGNHTLKKFREGQDEKHPLGNYFQEPNFAFKSDYAKVSPEAQARFAYDLNNYRKAAGLDWETVHKQPGDFHYMKYDKQHDFAEFYWLRNYPEFKNLGIADKERFINESLIDATTIYLIYRRSIVSSPDTVMYCASAVQHLIKKEP